MVSAHTTYPACVVSFYIKFRLETSYCQGQKSHILWCYFCLLQNEVCGQFGTPRTSDFPISDCISNVYIIEHVSKILFREQLHKNDDSVTKRIQLSSFSLTTLKMADS